MIFLCSLFLVLIYIVSMVYIAIICDKKCVELNILTLFLIMCPVLNSLLSLYFLNKQAHYKESLERIFNGTKRN